MPRISVTSTTEFDLDVKTAAAWFCELDDERQADFLIEVDAITSRWPGGGEGQWWYVMRHLNTCECSNESVREMIRTWAGYLETTRPHAPDEPWSGAALEAAGKASQLSGMDQNPFPKDSHG